MKTAFKALIGVLVAVLVLLGAAEAGMRWYISKELVSSFKESSTGDPNAGDPKVSFGPSPVLMALATGRMQQVDVDVPSTLVIGQGSVQGEPASRLKMRDLDLHGGVASEITVNSVLPREYLLAAFQQSLAENAGDGVLADLITVDDVQLNDANDTITVSFTGGAATLTLAPDPAPDGSVSLAATDVTLFGFGLPSQVSDAITTGLADQTSDMTITGMNVTPEGLDIEMHGRNVDLQDLESEQPRL